MNFDIVNEEYITKAEVKKILTSKKELALEQKLTKEHVKDYVALTPAKAEKLKKELELIDNSKLKQEILIKIIDIMPKTIEELKLIVQMSVIPFNQEEIEKVFECVKPYV